MIKRSDDSDQPAASVLFGPVSLCAEDVTALPSQGWLCSVVVVALVIAFVVAIVVDVSRGPFANGMRFHKGITY